MLAQNQNPTESNASSIPSIATQCFVLSNMFDPKRYFAFATYIFSFSLTAGKAYRLNYAYSEQGDSWAEEVRDDVIEECAKNGGMFLVLFGFGD